MRARVGSANWVFGGSVYRLKRAITHENFSIPTVDYDFALLEIDGTIKFGNNIRPVALPSVSHDMKDGTDCFVSGWGLVRPSIGVTPLRLRGVKVPITNQQKCFDAYKSIQKITPRMICAGSDKGGKDACQGINNIEYERNRKKIAVLIKYFHEISRRFRWPNGL